jgi:secreted trypsin-like serine protease
MMGGEDIGPHEWPWLAALYKTNDSGIVYGFLCGGSLVSSNIVITGELYYNSADVNS